MLSRTKRPSIPLPPYVRNCWPNMAAGYGSSLPFRKYRTKSPGRIICCAFLLCRRVLPHLRCNWFRVAPPKIMTITSQSFPSVTLSPTFSFDLRSIVYTYAMMTYSFKPLVDFTEIKSLM